MWYLSRMPWWKSVPVRGCWWSPSIARRLPSWSLETCTGVSSLSGTTGTLISRPCGYYSSRMVQIPVSLREKKWFRSDFVSRALNGVRAYCCIIILGFFPGFFLRVTDIVRPICERLPVQRTTARCDMSRSLVPGSHDGGYSTAGTGRQSAGVHGAWGALHERLELRGHSGRHGKQFNITDLAGLRHSSSRR